MLKIYNFHTKTNSLVYTAFSCKRKQTRQQQLKHYIYSRVIQGVAGDGKRIQCKKLHRNMKVMSFRNLVPV